MRSKPPPEDRRPQCAKKSRKRVDGTIMSSTLLSPFQIRVQNRFLTLKTSFSNLSKTCVVKLLCVLNICRAMTFPMPKSRSAMYPIWFPCGSRITYLFACSKPIMKFISSSCRCTTMDELARIAAAGCRRSSTPWGSSGTWTGARRLLFLALVSRRTWETAASWPDASSLVPCNSGFEGLGTTGKGCRTRRVLGRRWPRPTRGLRVAKPARNNGAVPRRTLRRLENACIAIGKWEDSILARKSLITNFRHSSGGATVMDGTWKTSPCASQASMSRYLLVGKWST